MCDQCETPTGGGCYKCKPAEPEKVEKCHKCKKWKDEIVRQDLEIDQLKQELEDSIDVNRTISNLNTQLVKDLSKHKAKAEAFDEIAEAINEWNRLEGKYDHSISLPRSMRDTIEEAINKVRGE